jgi:hypothetical protein
MYIGRLENLRHKFPPLITSLLAPAISSSLLRSSSKNVKWVALSMLYREEQRDGLVEEFEGGRNGSSTGVWFVWVFMCALLLYIEASASK